MARDPITRESFVEAAVVAFRARLESALEAVEQARTPVEFCAGERQVTRLAHEFADQLIGDTLQRMAEDPVRRARLKQEWSDRLHREGWKLASSGSRVTPVRLLNGTVVKVRAPYFVVQSRRLKRSARSREKNGAGVHPALAELGVAGRSTPALRLRVTRAVCASSSVAAAREALQSNGLTVPHKVALRLTYMTTEAALELRRWRVFATRSGQDDGEFAGRRIVAAVDGGRLRTRRRKRGGVPKGGRGAFDVAWREPKVLTIYVLGDDGRRDRSVRPVIDATLGDADAVYRLLLCHLRRLGAHRARDLTLVGDGARWIWARADDLRKQLGLPAEHFTEIVDYFHAVERLGTFVAEREWSDKRRNEWLKRQKERLKRGAIDKVIKGFQLLRDPSLTVAEVGTELQYWTRNSHRMTYGRFRELGLPLGSGAVESAIRRLVNQRIKGPGIFWTERHAEGVLHMRGALTAGRWDESEASILAQPVWRAPPPANVSA